MNMLGMWASLNLQHWGTMGRSHGPLYAVENLLTLESAYTTTMELNIAGFPNPFRMMTLR